MVQFIYRVSIVERGQEALWRDWRDTGRADRPIGRFELIEAHHIEDAIETAKRQFPDFTVMREGSEQICAA